MRSGDCSPGLSFPHRRTPAAGPCAHMRRPLEPRDWCVRLIPSSGFFRKDRDTGIICQFHPLVCQTQTGKNAPCETSSRDVFRPLSPRKLPPRCRRECAKWRSLDLCHIWVDLACRNTTPRLRMIGATLVVPIRARSRARKSKGDIHERRKTEEGRGEFAP